MKKIISLLAVVFIFINTIMVYAAKLDTNIPVPYNVTLTPEGNVSWTADSTIGIGYNKFQIRLMKRSVLSTSDSGNTTYQWSEYGSIKSVDGEERSADINIGSTGIYRVKVRAVNADNNYSSWGESSVDVAVTSNDVGTTVIVNNNGGYNWTSGGPGVSAGINNQGTSLYIGADGSLQYSSNNLYNTNTNQNGLNIFDKNAFAQSMQQSNYSATQISAIGPGQNSGTTQTNQVGPGVNLGTTQINQVGPGQNINTTQQQQETGWHVDSKGRYYNTGTGSYLKSMWAIIDGKYYRFDANGYVYMNCWYKDSQNNCWYYLGLNGEMYTGWQFINGSWYYLNPERGTNYGAMYANTIVQVDGKYYAFSQEGHMISNAWYNGRYYGADGAQI